MLASRARCSRLSERYPYWYWIALLVGIVAARFVMSGWGIWLVVSLLFLFIGATFSRVTSASWVRESIRSGVETTVADPATWEEVARRRYGWAKNVTLSMALFIVFLSIAFEAIVKR